MSCPRLKKVSMQAYRYTYIHIIIYLVSLVVFVELLLLPQSTGARESFTTRRSLQFEASQTGFTLCRPAKFQFESRNAPTHVCRLQLY